VSRIMSFLAIYVMSRFFFSKVMTTTAGVSDGNEHGR
jgi:hypothetical protein